MKKTILKFIKSPTFDFILFVIILVFLFVLYGIYCIRAAAADYDSDGNLVFTGTTFGTYQNYGDSGATPVVDANHSIPSGYKLVGYYYVCAWSNRSTCSWIYAPNDVTEMTAYYDSDNRPNWSYSPNSTPFYVITNNFFSDNTQAIITTQSGSYTSQRLTGNSELVIFIPCYDHNGDIVRPETQISFNLNTLFDSSNRLFYNASSNSMIDSPVSFYLFPSSVPITSGSTATIIQDTYVSELSPSELYGLGELGYKLDFGQNLWNDYLAYGLVPEIHFYKRSVSSRSSQFDADSFGLPYVLLNSLNLHSSSDFDGFVTQTTCLDLKQIKSSSEGVYAFDDLCIVAVVYSDNRYFISRGDFNVNQLLSGTPVPPTSLEGKDSYVSGNVSDLQELADYLKYLVGTRDNNNSIDFRNLIAMLQQMPWSNYVGNGVYNGLNGFLPNLSSEFDTVFNGLFTDFFVPDLEAIESQVDEDEAAFTDKFQWVHDVKAEVNFIVHTPLAADDDEFVYKADITYYDIGEVIIFDSEWIDGSTRIIVKRVIIVFCTIALIVYIFKTLPSTLGNMPSD